MNAHFFDINSLITSNGQVWLVSKTKPNFPIVKILPSDFNLIKSGVFKKFEQKINVSGVDYWLPKDLADKIKMKIQYFLFNSLKIYNLNSKKDENSYKYKYKKTHK